MYWGFIIKGGGVVRGEERKDVTRNWIFPESTVCLCQMYRVDSLPPRTQCDVLVGLYKNPMFQRRRRWRLCNEQEAIEIQTSWKLVAWCQKCGKKFIASSLFLSPFHSDKEVVEIHVLEFQCVKCMVWYLLPLADNFETKDRQISFFINMSVANYWSNLFVQDCSSCRLRFCLYMGWLLVYFSGGGLSLIRVSYIK